MKTFQKVQIFSSVIPGISTVFVASVTMFKFKQQRASAKLWLLFLLTFIVSGIAASLLNMLVFTNGQTWGSILVNSIIFAVANTIFVRLQILSENPENKKKIVLSYKKIVITTAIILGIVTTVLLLYLLLAPSNVIEDINGSDTSLAVITAEEIETVSDDYSARVTATQSRGDKTEVEKRWEEYDYDHIRFRCQIISGIKTLQITKTDKNEMTLSIQSEVEKGNMEIFVLVDGVFFDRFPANYDGSITLTDIANKNVVVKLAAESAKADITVERQTRTD